MTPPRKRANTKPKATGAARIPKRSQGFYRDPETGDKLRSVTTILNQGVPKEALIFWAGNIVAECAIENLPHLVKASRSTQRRTDAYDWLRRAHTRKKDERADIGSAVHKLIEAHILEQPVPDELMDDPEMVPFLEHFWTAVADFDITFTASEMVVANPDDGWAGTLDYMLTSPIIAAALNLPADTQFMGDTKTGGELDEITSAGYPKGVYPEAGLQMSAYRKGSVCWLRDGQKVPMPITAEVGLVLHLRPQGYRIYPAGCGDEVYAKFLHAKQVAEWTTALSKTVLGDPLTAPKRDTQEGAA
jgi:hypothetical protein